MHWFMLFINVKRLVNITFFIWIQFEAYETLYSTLGDHFGMYPTPHCNENDLFFLSIPYTMFKNPVGISV